MPSHGEVSRALGISVASISRFRSGERVPNRENMEVVAKALNWPVMEQVGLEYLGGVEAWRDAFEARLRAAYPDAEE